MKRQIELPEVEQVQLPHWFGLRPGVIILILLLLALVTVLFLVAFFPGILKGGRYVTFSSPFAESGVYVDGIYLGSTDHQYFVGSGEHTVAIRKADISVAEYTMEIDHPVFLTWLFHRTLSPPTPSLDLSETEKLAINTFNLEEVVRASAILSYDSVVRYKPVFSVLCNDLQVLGLNETTKLKTIELALLFISNQTMLEEAQEAFSACNFELSEKAEEILTTIDGLFSNPDNTEVGLAEVSLPVATDTSELIAGSLKIAGYQYPGTTFVMGEKTKNAYPDTNQAGVAVSTKAFNIASQEVTQYQWALFTQANPQWDSTNRDTLIASQLVDEYYLAGQTISPVFVTSKPVYAVSYHAAQAFCEWLSKESGKEVFLPSEIQWSLAAMTTENNAFSKSLTPIPNQENGPQALLGGVWEMTQTPYIPLGRVVGYEYALDLYTALGLAVRPIVKGGSYLSDPNSITIQSVGVIENDACGDQIGFRIAWY